MSDNPAGETLIGVKSPSMTLVVAASAAGTAFEWYDFFVFVPLASILAKVFAAGLNEAIASPNAAADAHCAIEILIDRLLFAPTGVSPSLIRESIPR